MLRYTYICNSNLYVSVVYDGCFCTCYLNIGFSQAHNPFYAQTELLKKAQIGCCYMFFFIYIYFRQFDLQGVHNIGSLI